MKNRSDKLKSFVKLALLIYAFLLSIELIKRASLLAPNVKDFLMQNLTPIKSFSAGWFVTSIVQSSSAVGSITSAFAGNNLIDMHTAVFILIGALFGTTITAMIISFITEAKNRRDFRHGFEIGLCFSIYSAFLVIIVFLLEYFFRIFSRLSILIASLFGDKLSLFKIPDVVGFFTLPIADFLFDNNNKILLLIFAFGILVFVMKFTGRTMINVFGGEEKARKFVNRHFNSKFKSYFIGVFLTAIVFSSSITIGLLVPLAVARLINLKKAIPFMIGANLGTSTDLLIASLVIGKTASLAVAVSYMLFGILGALIFLPNTEFLFRTTKYVSKKVIYISRKKALYILLGFILIPLAVILLF